jgi:(E)-4-hydroxy-3-methylbut-2-enyl-diphosphate synthase
MFETINKYKNYCLSLTEYSRYKTREVQIGNVPCGGNNPIRIQSMTTTDTMNTIATVEQTIRMVEAGCEYVRITAPSKLEAENLSVIKKELRQRGYNVPLVADIHFTPNAAEIAARIVEKVRINPGNYADRKKFEVIDYTDSAYNDELQRIRKKFLPLIKICKEYGTAMRIGTNHGSLSDRIMSRYGDTPHGMVESALEFARICEDLNYYNIVFSMKSSNPQIMVQAYRLLIQKMNEEGMNYPLHLGVTEAGGGEDGRIKSAVGIGTLLEDGIGDTIRVSLTEEPEYEAPVAVYLADRYKNRLMHEKIKEFKEIPFDAYSYKRRTSFEVENVGGSNVPRVFADFSGKDEIDYKDFADIGYLYEPEPDKWNLSDAAADFLFMGEKELPFEPPHPLKIVVDFSKWISTKKYIPLFTADEYLNSNVDAASKFVKVKLHEIDDLLTSKLQSDREAVIILETKNLHGMAEQRRAFCLLIENNLQNPVIIKRSYSDLNLDQLRIYSSTDIGALLIDGFGDGVWIQINSLKEDQTDGKHIRKFIEAESLTKIINRTLFGILQAARVRISKTEYIACPSCGRTLFDLQETTEKIRSRTEHLKGLKIAIMGCIVNGPGEMADADYGYVGSGVGKITLYKGKEIVRRNIPAADAVNILINIIKENGEWIDPK